MKELLLVIVKHLRTIRFDSEFIERKIQNYSIKMRPVNTLLRFQALVFERHGTGSDGGRCESVSRWLALSGVIWFGAKVVVIWRKDKPLWHLQTWRCVSSKATDPWSQVALRDQGFAIGSMPVEIEAAIDGPTQTEECCCGW